MLSYACRCCHVHVYAKWARVVGKYIKIAPYKYDDASNFQEKKPKWEREKAERTILQLHRANSIPSEDMIYVVEYCDHASSCDIGKD